MVYLEAQPNISARIGFLPTHFVPVGLVGTLHSWLTRSCIATGPLILRKGKWRSPRSGNWGWTSWVIKLQAFRYPEARSFFWKASLTKPHLKWAWQFGREIVYPIYSTWLGPRSWSIQNWDKSVKCSNLTRLTWPCQAPSLNDDLAPRRGGKVVRLKHEKCQAVGESKHEFLSPFRSRGYST